jgi:DNA-directed RNA polymerase specialized sigma subunit
LPQVLRAQVAQLPPLERKVIDWRFGLSGLRLTRAEMAARLGVSCYQVQRLERTGIALLRLVNLVEAL